MAEDNKKQFVAAVNNHVAELAKNNTSPSQIVSSLLVIDSVRPLIEEGRAAGMSEEQIVEKLGGKPYQPYAAANRKIEEQGGIGNFVRGMGDVGGDVMRTVGKAGDWAMGNDAGVEYGRRLQAEAEANPMRMARERTASGEAGQFAAKVAPNVVAAALTGGASLPAQAAIQGGVSAASTALSDPHATAGDIALSGGLGALAVPASVVGKGVTAALGKAGEKAAARAASIESKALNVSEDGIDRSTFNRGVAERLGLKDYQGPVDQTMVKTADQNAKAMFEAASKGRAVQPTKQFRDFVAKTADEDLEEGGKAIRRLVGDDQFAPGTFVSPKKWIEMRSKVAQLARDAKGQDAHYIGNIVEKMDDIMAAGRAPEQVQMLQQARQVWRNLQPVEDMVKKSGDSGNITWNHFKSSISKDVDKYSRGQAPLQDLSEVAKQLQPQGKLIDAIKGSGTNNALNVAAIAMPKVGVPVKAAQLLANNPTALRGTASLLKSASKGTGNKLAQQLLGQLASRGTGSR
jgi:hypothetical protein